MAEDDPRYCGECYAPAFVEDEFDLEDDRGNSVPHRIMRCFNNHSVWVLV